MEDGRRHVWGWAVVDDSNGLVDLVTALQCALSKGEDLREKAKAVFPALRITRNVLDRLADEEKPNLGEEWRVRVKQVGDGLLVVVYREVEYSGGHIGTFEMSEGQMFALFKRTGEVVVGTEEFFRKELEA